MKSCRNGYVSRGFEIVLFLSATHTAEKCFDEKRYGLASLLYIQCSCGQINTVHTGKSHQCSDARRGVLVYDVNTKLATGT